MDTDGFLWYVVGFAKLIKKKILISEKKRKRQLTAKLQAFGVPPIPDNCGMMD